MGVRPWITRGRAVVAAIVAVLSSAVTLPAARPDRTAPDCVPVQVVALGPACALPNGPYRVTLPDGWTLETHGPDQRVADQGSIEGRFFDGLAAKPPSCVSNSETDSRIEVIYARPSDVSANRFTTMVPVIRRMIGQVNAMLDVEAKEFGLSSIRFRMLCSGTNVRVTRFDLSTRRSATNYSSVVSALRSAGRTDPLTKYWIWVDATLGAVLGVADIRHDTLASPRNLSNYGPNYATFFGITGGLGAEVIMHEASHSLGAVARGAPHANSWVSSGSSYAFHCYDDQDVMCYQSAAGSRYRSSVCTRVHYDCRHDDYFSPRPKTGTYLAKYWNIGAPYNRYIAGCQYRSGRIPLPLRTNLVDDTARAVPGYPPLSTARVSIAKGCWNHPFATYGSIAPATTTLRANGIDVDGDIIPADRLSDLDGDVDIDVCFYKNTTLLRCHSSAPWEKGTVPSGATSAQVVLVAGVQVNWVLSIM